MVNEAKIQRAKEKLKTEDVVREVTAAVNAFLDSGALEDGKVTLNEILTFAFYLLPVLQRLLR